MTDDSPDKLVPVQVTARDLKSGRLVQVGVATRRSSEAKLWGSLARVPDHERAALRIGAAFAQISRGIGVQESALARAMRADGQGGGRPDPSWLAALIYDYFEWGKACTRERISHAAIMDILAYGYSCRETDRRRRQYQGWARRQLTEGLELYGRLRGWTKAA